MSGAQDPAQRAMSAFIALVAEAEDLVGALRRHFDPSARLGVPAHIAPLMAFMAPQRISGDVMRRAAAVLAALPAFEFRLHELGRFATTTYLAPEPAAPFVALTEALCGAFPSFLPYVGERAEIVPHRSVAHGDAAQADIAEIELTRSMQAHGAIHARCHSVSLLENSSGRWREMRSLSLQSGDPAP
jgi:hypothetical protein